MAVHIIDEQQSVFPDQVVLCSGAAVHIEAHMIGQAEKELVLVVDVGHGIFFSGGGLFFNRKIKAELLIIGGKSDSTHAENILSNLYSKMPKSPTITGRALRQ